MIKKIFFAFFLLFLTNFVKAEEMQPSKTDSTYIINEININKEDENATVAREKAIFDGQRRAFNIILNRIGIDVSNSIFISNEEISRMLRSMQIKNEKVTSNSYSATLSMEFSAEFIKYILNKYNITKFTGKINSYLIVPILNEDNNIFLWGKNNRWIPAFANSLKSVRNIVLINNDEASKNAFNINYINNPTFSKFYDLSKLYNVNNIVLIVSQYDKKAKMISSKITVLNEEETRNASLNYQVKNLNNSMNDFNEASSKIIGYLNKINETKKTELSEQINNEITKVFFSISSIDNLNDSENILKSNKNVISSFLKSLTKNIAVYDVKIYNNDIESFVFSLRENGFSVDQKDEGIYIYLK